MTDDKYPPGVTSGTKNAPWNPDPIERCSECDCILDENPEHDTIDGEECPQEGLTKEQFLEDQIADHQEMKMEEQRLEEFEESIE